MKSSFLSFVQKTTERQQHQQQPHLYHVNVLQCIILFSIAIAILLSFKYYAEDHINDSWRL